MNNRLPPRWLVVGLMMFPQIVETIYSPVLTHIATAFRVSEGQASQTLSVYFLAFAAGVVCWGRLCDLIGRRPAMLAGLLTYGAGTLLALLATQFETLLLARVIAAFGAAVGSVVTQTMLRDSYQGSDLARVFSVMGIALSLSPVLGLVSGGLLADGLGYVGVFGALLALAIGLLLMACWQLPETRPATTQRVALWPLACRMVRDTGLWRSAALVALFNTMLFGYYSLAPFLFAGLGLSAGDFGYSGIVLALVFIGLPFAVRTLQPVLETLGREPEEAAASLGAGRFTSLRRVVLPELLPAWLTGFSLAFARGLGEYGSVIFIAGNLPYKTEIAPLLVTIRLEEYDYDGAVAIAALLLVASFACLLVINLIPLLFERGNSND